MLTTLSAVLLLFGVTLIANAAILLAVALLFRAPKAGVVAAVIIAAINPIAQILILVMLYVAYEPSPVAAIMASILGVILALIIPLLLIHRLFAVSWGKSFGVYLLWGVGGGAVNAAIALGFRAYVLDTYYVPTSAMAPTIAGVHRLGTCPHCGETMVVSTPLEEDGRPNTENEQGICSSCLSSADATQIGAKIIFGDRIISDKLLQPTRWDIATYYPPVAPNVLYVSRVVGMPGESVLVKNGQVWIDGVAQSPPAGLEKLKYAGTVEMKEQVGMAFGMEWGVGDKPYQLAADECFVLGDNTFRSSDSRFFGPVKMNQVTGVVTMRYWPPIRATFLQR